MADEIVSAQYEALKKQINDIAKTMDLRFQQWDEDRKSITDLEVRLKTIEAKLEGARDDINDQTQKVMNKVDEHLSPMADIVASAVSEAVKKKKGLFK
jgi:predicted  nucleic acid-binding Zn-ribbon protein